MKSFSPSELKNNSPSDFKDNFSNETLETLSVQACATVEIHKDWPEDMKEAFAKSTYQFFGYRALFQIYSRKIQELEKNGSNPQELLQLKKQYQTLQSEYQATHSTLDILKEKFNSLQHENMNLNSLVSDLQEQLEDEQTASNLFQNALNPNATSSEDFLQLKKQYQLLQNEHQSTCNTLNLLKEKFDNLQHENMNLNSLVSDLQEQLEDAQTVPLSSETDQLQKELEILRKQNQALTAQLKSAPQTSSVELPEKANSLLKEIAQKLQEKQQFSSELSFLELEKDCLSELISSIQPDEESFQLPVLQERFSKNHDKISALQEQLQQTEERLLQLNQTLQDDFF